MSKTKNQWQADLRAGDSRRPGIAAGDDRGELRLPCGCQGLAQVRDRVEHRRHFLGIVTGGPFCLEAVDPVRDGTLAGAEFFYPLGGECGYLL